MKITKLKDYITNQIKRRKRLKQARVNLKLWLQGENINPNDFSWSFETQSIRVKRNEIETTGGVQISLTDALCLLNAIELGKIEHGYVIGAYTYYFDAIDTITVECHKLSLNHVKKVLKKYMAS